MPALIQQESGGRVGISGQHTAYGTPLGMTQMLPDTAREMAGKLGVPFRPDLLTAKNDMGAAYQRMLGEAYLKEGIHATGNVRDGLRYYHGGPNRALWGQKTNAHADSILSRLGGR